MIKDAILEKNKMRDYNIYFKKITIFNYLRQNNFPGRG